MSADAGIRALRDRRVLITGASSGIGAATARTLAQAGAHVALLARRGDRLDRLAAELDAVPVVADLSEPEQIAPAVDRAAERLGGLDALVNNAGTFLLGMVGDGSLQSWRTMLDVNVMGLLAVTRAAIPHLRSSSGPSRAIVNVSSMGGRRVAQPAQGVYAGTKHAVHAISDGLRAELHADRIAVTVIAPGFVHTNLGAGIEDPAVRENMRRGQCEQGLRPEDVAAQIAHVLAAPPEVSLVEVALISMRQALR